MNIQGWFPLGLTGLISLQSKRLNRVSSSTTVQKHQFFSTQPSPFFFFFDYSKMVHFLFSFLTLCLCFQYFHNDPLLFNEESALNPVPDTFSTHGTTIGSADVFLRFRQPHENSRSHSTSASKSAWAHTTCRFWCFPNLLGIKVNNSITRDLGQPGFVRGCISGQPTTVR